MQNGHLPLKRAYKALAHACGRSREFGQRGVIRTRDPLRPRQVRYRTALHAGSGADDGTRSHGLSRDRGMLFL